MSTDNVNRWLLQLISTDHPNSWLQQTIDWLIHWFGLLWFGLIWFWFDLIWSCSWFDLIWFGLIWFDLIWFDLIWFDVMWCDLFIDCLLNWSMDCMIDWLAAWLIESQTHPPSPQPPYHATCGHIGIALLASRLDLKFFRACRCHEAFHDEGQRSPAAARDKSKGKGQR